MNKKKAWSFMYAPSDAVNAPASEVFFPRGGGGRHLSIFWWICAAWDSKFVPCSKKKNSPKIDAPF